MGYPNITDVNLSKGFQEALYYVNEVTDSWISNMILIGIYFIVCMGIFNRKKDFVEAMSIAGFFTFLIAMTFWIAGFVSGVTLVFVIGVAILGFVLLWLGKKSD